MKNIIFLVLLMFLYGCESLEEKIERKNCKAISVNQFKRTSFGQPSKRGYFTDVNYKCEDGSYFVSERRGLWDLEDIQPKEKE